VEETAPSFARFSRFLLLVPEHTWGMDIKTHLGDFTHYAAEEFQAARSQPAYQKVESSWEEQRGYLQSALQALGESPLANEAKTALRRLEPVRPDLSGYEMVPDQAAEYETAHFILRFNERGAISRLVQKSNGLEWACPDHPLGLFCYQTFSAADYARFHQQYNINQAETAEWAIPDFTKPGMENTLAEQRDWLPQTRGVYHRRDESGHYFCLRLSMPGEAHARYGCPRDVFIQVTLPDDRPGLQAPA
jgi:hypothetical protein